MVDFDECLKIDEKKRKNFTKEDIELLKLILNEDIITIYL